MGLFLGRVLAGTVGFMALDFVWLGLLMSGFYRQQLAPIARLANGSFAPHWPSAFAVYVLLGLGIAAFVVPRATSVLAAAGYGALFGLVTYGVYDFTNYCTLKDYPLVLVFVDLAWGAVASATCSAAVSLVGRS
jgi:uncharacterized membrane protein